MADNVKTEQKTQGTTPSADFLIQGSKYLERYPNFKLVGRDEELKQAAMVLMRKDNNHLVMYGETGVGTSAIMLGLQASKSDVNTPYDIVGKRFYWLDTDALFSSGDINKINEGFQKALATLSRSPDTVLCMDDVKDFLDGCAKNNAGHLVNALMRELRNGRFQAGFECRGSSLGDFFKCHSDVAEIFTFNEVGEPSKEALREIIKQQTPSMETFHGIKIAEAAIDNVIDLTFKYPGLTLNVAQPKRSLVLLEGALTSLRYRAHSRPMQLDGLEERLEVVTDLLTKGKSGLKLPEFEGKPKEQLEVAKREIEETIANVNREWEEHKKAIHTAYKGQREAEEALRDIEDQIAVQRERKAYAAELNQEYNEAEGDEAKQKEIKKRFKDKYGDELVIRGEEAERNFFEKKVAKSELEIRRDELLGALNKERAAFRNLTKNSESLQLGAEEVLSEFSRLSRIPLSKLQQDETERYLNMEEEIKKRVFGQDEPIVAVSDAIRIAKEGLKEPGKPIGNFIFLGPSGVGKTELGKALAEFLFGDESSLNVYDMSEFQEKTATAKMIGADPGLVGYEEGGRLTNAMRKRPYCVNVFDEVEKAHRDVFDLFLQIFDEGRLTDSRGLPASFGNAINIMTSNIGAKYFLDEKLLTEEEEQDVLDTIKLTKPNATKESREYIDERAKAEFDKAKALALKDLWDPAVGGFRPEFLNRATGIFCFNRLGQVQILMVTDKALRKLNEMSAPKGVTVEMTVEEKKKMCKAKYLPKNGGRGLINYINTNVKPEVAKTLMRSRGQKGKINVVFDAEKNAAVSTFTPETSGANAAVLGAANDDKSGKAVAAAKSAFKPTAG